MNWHGLSQGLRAVALGIAFGPRAISFYSTKPGNAVLSHAGDDRERGFQEFGDRGMS